MQDLTFDLQLFSEGGMDGGTGGAESTPVTTNTAPQEAQVNTGATHSKAAAYAERARRYAKLDGRQLVPDAAQAAPPPVADQKSQVAADIEPVQDTTEDTPPVAEETFDSLIGKNGKYEKEYNARMSAAIKGRLKGAKQAEEKLREVAPIIGRIAEHMGMPIDDIYKLDAAELIKRFDKDTRLIADEADRDGKDENDLAKFKSLERKSKDEQLLAAMDAEAERIREAEEAQLRRMDQIDAESKALKQKYPTFDLATELQSEKFKKLLSAGLSIEDAYETAHWKDFFSGGMKYAAKKAEQKVAASIQANKQRPAEAGMRSGTTAHTSIPDFRSMSPKEFREYVARVKAGERLNF